MTDLEFGTQLEHSRSKLRYLALKLFHARAEQTEDLVQETMLHAWAKREQFRGDAQLSTWVGRIMINVFRDQKRKARSRPQSAEVWDTEYLIQSVEDSSAPRRIENAAQVKQVLRIGLPIRYKTVIPELLADKANLSKSERTLRHRAIFLLKIRLGLKPRSQAA